MDFLKSIKSHIKDNKQKVPPTSSEQHRDKNMKEAMSDLSVDVICNISLVYVSQEEVSVTSLLYVQVKFSCLS